MMQPTTPKLSICIATFNRAAFLGATLESIVSQVTSDCEIVIADNASTDSTKDIVAQYSHRFDRLRYVRQDTNQGLDRNFDYAVELAQGEYCWLFPDDDLLKPGAVATVLQALRQELSLVLMNYERMDCNMSNVLMPRFLDMHSDQVYRPDDMDRLFAETGQLLMYIGCVVIKRSVWLARERKPYYGSMFIHLAVIFQQCLPGDALLIAKPLVSYRQGNVSWLSSTPFDLLIVRWPSLVWSLAPSESAKMKVCSNKESWRNLRTLLTCRALGWYSLTEYQRWVRPHMHSLWGTFTRALIATIPGVLMNTLYVLYFSLTRDRYRDVMLRLLNESPFHLRNWSARPR